MKKFLSIMLTLCITLSGFMAVSAATSTDSQTRAIIAGDANRDGKIDLYDAIEIAKAILKNQVDMLPRSADFNVDGKIDLYDAIGISQYILDSIPKVTTSPNKVTTKATTKVTVKTTVKTTAKVTAKTTNNQSKTVYITPTGQKYHYNGTCNGGTYIKSTLAEALKKGLTPCKKCVK